MDETKIGGVRMRNAKFAFVVPTKDRPRDLVCMLDSFCSQTHLPDQVVIVDASAEPVREIVESYRDRLPVEYLRWDQQPSAASQRNAGFERVREDIKLIAFFDDDQILHPDAVARMFDFWITAPESQGGAAFNYANYVDPSPARFKRSWLAESLGLYTRKPGGVAPSGWQTVFGKVECNLDVEWLPSGATVLHRKIIDEFRFDDYFTGYSYLEDLEFSYSISRKYRLTIVAEALFEHYPALGGRISAFKFGETEVRNRIYFVKKHGLSIPACYLGICIRFFISLIQGFIFLDPSMMKRAMGNLCKFLAQSMQNESSVK